MPRIMNRSSSKQAHKMDSIDETSVFESSSSTTIATVDSPSRSVNTTSSSSDTQSVSSDALHSQLQLIEEAEIAHTISISQHLQEGVLDNPHKPVPPLIFKYILICMGLCGVLIGIVLGAIIGQHLLKQNQAPRYMEPSSLDDVLENDTHAPSAAPGLDWYYPPTPRPSSSDIFDHNHSPPPTPVRTAHPTVASSTLMPTTNSSSGNETGSFETLTPSNNNNSTDNGDEGQIDEHVNGTKSVLP